jgi:hypothetical protein
LTKTGIDTLHEERRHRAGWLAQAIEGDLSPEEQAVLADAVELLRRLAEN